MDLTYNKVYKTLIFKTAYIHVLIHVLAMLYMQQKLTLPNIFRRE